MGQCMNLPPVLPVTQLYLDLVHSAICTCFVVTGAEQGKTALSHFVSQEISQSSWLGKLG